MRALKIANLPSTEGQAIQTLWLSKGKIPLHRKALCHQLHRTETEFNV